MDGLCIANPTKQDFIFHYRRLAKRAEDRILQHVAIPTGSQANIGSGWKSEEVEHVIKQLEAYGGRDAAESYHGKLGKFSGLLYRRQAQIETQEIEAGHESIVDTQEKRSVQETTRGALGFDRSVNGGKRGARASKTTAVEVIQQLQPGARVTGKEVNFSMEVDPNGRSDAQISP